jgi:hypothetical protein
MSDSEWVKNAAKEFQALISDRSQKDAVTLEDERIRKEFIDKLWSDIVIAFNEKHMSLNHEMKRQVLTIVQEPGSRSFTLLRNEPTTERINVKCEGYSILIKGGKDDWFDVRLDVEIDRQSGTAYLADRSSGGEKRTPEKIAESAIKHLVSFR